VTSNSPWSRDKFSERISQPEPSSHYAQARKRTKNEQVGVGDSYKKRRPADKLTKSPEQLLKECLAGCGPKPRLRRRTDAAIRTKLEELRRRVSIYRQCVRTCWVRFENSDKKAKMAHGCPPRPPRPSPGEFVSWTDRQREDFKKAVMEHKLCVERSGQEDHRDDEVLLEEGTTCYPWPSFSRNVHRALSMVFRLILTKLGLRQSAPRARPRGVTQSGSGVLVDGRKPCLLCRPSLGPIEVFLYRPPLCGLFLHSLSTYLLRSE
jgi:hypothetical protein